MITLHDYLKLPGSNSGFNSVVALEIQVLSNFVCLKKFVMDRQTDNGWVDHRWMDRETDK